MSLQWIAVVPVKALATAKSRLDPGPSLRRRDLATAFAADTVTALHAVEAVRAVAVVGSDDQLAEALPGTRVVLLDEPVPADLNRAAQRGIDWAVANHPDAGIVVVPADLPALRPSDVTEMLRLASAHPRAVLGDEENRGTTMLSGLPGSPPRPRFGTDSLSAHRADGAVVIDGAGLARAARDVDTVLHLMQVRRLGVGAATARVLDDR